MAANAAKVYVPNDTTARSVGADAVADAIASAADERGIAIEVVRNGSRGLYWLEPLVEVDVAGERIAFGPVTADDVPGLFDISYSQGLMLTIVTVGCVGALYAIFGGLRAVAVSDTLNGIGLLIIGIIVPILGLSALGDGNIGQGLQTITSTNTEKLNAIRGTTDNRVV